MLTSLKSCRSPCTWTLTLAVTMLQRETPRVYPSRDVAIRFARFESGGLQATASGVSFKRVATVRRSMMWRSWKNVCWGSGGCWTTPSSRQRLRSGVVVNGGHFEHKVWASDFLLCFVCFIDTGCPKCDRYKHVQSANIVWNVLHLCLRLSHGMVAT